jgi:hypothetical protein
MADWLTVGSAGDGPEGQLLGATAGDVQVLVANVEELPRGIRLAR